MNAYYENIYEKKMKEIYKDPTKDRRNLHNWQTNYAHKSCYSLTDEKINNILDAL